MSWSCDYVGTADKIAAALKVDSEKMTGQSKVEFDAALPHLVGLLENIFDDPAATGGQTRITTLQANGSGSTKTVDGQTQQVSRSVYVKLETAYAMLV